ncbi:hypothetical protein CERSUDRAFT_100806 [Gelatoporia subvermispora B]|uniref:Uncharacterized protein n=1 Tax=Ceriporiopsis subvermispora (strain B) TaxID=914234 RepID=M2QG63_CERS8|nr:hypothetical protein CERSUDRAFT_100806 [Gelatoporia subvermispora B]
MTLAEKDKDEAERTAPSVLGPPSPSHSILSISTANTADSDPVDSGRQSARPHINATPSMYQPVSIDPRRAPSKDSTDDTSRDIALAEAEKDETEHTVLLLVPQGCPPSHDHPAAATGDTVDATPTGPGRQTARPHADATLPMYQPVAVSEVTSLLSSADTLSDRDMEKSSAGCKHDVDPKTIGKNLYAIVCAIFGVWHCIAWNSYFPTNVEHLLWRIASIISALLAIPFFVSDKISGHQFMLFNLDLTTWTIKLIEPIGYSMYIFARGFLLLEMFLSLRRMPDTVFQTVQWTNFIPHI